MAKLKIYDKSYHIIKKRVNNTGVPNFYNFTNKDRMPIPYKQKSLLKFSYMHAIGQKLKIQHHVNNFGHFLRPKDLFDTNRQSMSSWKYKQLANPMILSQLF